MFFFVLGVYANTVKENTNSIDEITNKLEFYQTSLIKCGQISMEAKEQAEKSIAYNKSIEVLMLEVKTELASIKTDITWIKESLKDKK